MNEPMQTPPAPAQGDNQQRNIIIAVVAGVILLCICCCGAAGAWWLWNNGDALIEQLGRTLPGLLSA